MINVNIITVMEKRRLSKSTQEKFKQLYTTYLTTRVVSRHPLYKETKSEIKKAKFQAVREKCREMEELKSRHYITQMHRKR